MFVGWFEVCMFLFVFLIFFGIKIRYFYLYRNLLWNFKCFIMVYDIYEMLMDILYVNFLLKKRSEMLNVYF